MTALHVAPRDGGWILHKAGEDEGIAFATRSAAVGFARLGQMRPVYVHSADGRIEEVIRDA